MLACRRRNLIDNHPKCASRRYSCYPDWYVPLEWRRSSRRLSAFVAPNVYAQADPQAHIAASEATLSNFLRDPNMDWLQRNFGRAKAVIITPLIVKAGFIFGGSGACARGRARSERAANG